MWHPELDKIIPYCDSPNQKSTDASSWTTVVSKPPRYQLDGENFSIKQLVNPFVWFVVTWISSVSVIVPSKYNKRQWYYFYLSPDVVKLVRQKLEETLNWFIEFNCGIFKLKNRRRMETDKKMTKCYRVSQNEISWNHKLVFQKKIFEETVEWWHV